MKNTIIIAAITLCAFMLTGAFFPYVFVQGTGSIVTRNGNTFTFSDSSYYKQGWALYRDTTHTVSNPQLISQGAIDTLDNIADSTITMHLPLGITGFYDKVNKRLTPDRAGDAYTFSIRFKAKNSNNDGFMTVEVVPNAFTNPPIAGQTVSFRKGVNTEQLFQFAFNATIRSTPPTAYIRITADQGNLQLYDMEYAIIRIMRGR